MKKFVKNQPEKSWRITLIDMGANYVMLVAVDARLGTIIANLIGFDNGDVRIFNAAKQALVRNGYDPFEHNNKWTDNGELKILDSELKK